MAGRYATMGTVGRPSMTAFRHDELRRRRIHAGLTQEAAAELLGVSRWTYRHWEGGQHAPLAERLPQIAAALDCDVADLVEPPTTLADYRTVSGLTQADVADRLGVSRYTVAAWEQGRMPIAAKHHDPLAVVLGLAVDELPLT